MSRWVWIVCLFGVLTCKLAATHESVVEVDEAKLVWLRYGVQGINETSNNKTLFNEEVNEEEKINAITYGYNTRRGQYPFMTSIMIYYYGYYYHLCGGVIYDRHTILTAAHCLRYINYYQYYVGVGIYDIRLGLGNSGSQFIKVTSHTIHSHYDRWGPGMPHNIALLHLECRITYNTYVKPARLATKYDGRYSYSYCYMIGYGRTEWGYPRILQQAYIYGITNYRCKLFWAIVPQAKILGSHLCMYRYPISSCYGDAGGPVVCYGKVAGLISWSRRYCNGCSPTVCTRVTSYNSWITKMARPE